MRIYHGLKVDDNVWYMDCAYSIVAIKDNQIKILEHNPRIRVKQRWVDASELELMVGEENDSFNYLVKHGWGNG